MTILSTKILSLHQQELLLNTGLGLVHYNALTVELLTTPQNQVFAKNLVITSQNASYALNALKPDEHAIYCVGSKTAQQVASRGFKVAHVAINAIALAQHLISSPSAATGYTYLCGTDRREELPMALLASKIDFKEVKVYRTNMVERRYRRIFAAVLCYSPRGVIAYAKANLKQTKCAICIGKTTATEAQNYFEKVVTATIPTIENTIITAYKALQHD